MITAKFYRVSDSALRGYRVSGHAGLAEAGEDVCCAAVSSAVMMTANTMTECFGIRANVTVDEKAGAVGLRLQEGNEDGEKLIQGLFLQLQSISDEFKGKVRITIVDEN